MNYKIGPVHLPAFLLKRKRLMTPAGFLLISALLLQGTGCKKKSGNEGPPPIAHSCRVEEHIDSTWDGSVVNKLGKTTHSYDDKGNEVSRTYLENDKYSDGTSENYTTNTIYQYDKDGFITLQSTQTNFKKRDNSSNSSNSTEQDQYEQGRLTRQLTVVNTSNVATVAYLWNYVYDSSGRLVKEVESVNNYPYVNIIYDYTGGVLSEIVFTNYNGVKTTPYFEMNAQGLFTKTIEGTDETRYQYDALGQLIRREYWVNGKPSDATAWEYDSQKNVTGLELADPKGSPPLYYLSNLKFRFSVHNPVKVNQFLADPSGQWAGNGYDQLTYQYNSQGYPLTALKESFDAKGNKLASGMKSTYSYTNCD